MTLPPHSRGGLSGISAALEKYVSANISDAAQANLLRSCLAAIELRHSGNTLQISFPHAYFADYCGKALPALENAIRACLGPDIIIDYASENAREPVPVPPEAPPDPFAGFIVSDRNRMALKAAKDICESSDRVMLLVIEGPGGSGKSHLLGAIGSALRASRGFAACHLHHACSFNPDVSPEAYWNKPRALLLDDVHELSGNNAIQLKLARHIDCAEASCHWCRIVLAFGQKNYSALNDRLARRLERCLKVELCDADLGMRLAYAESRCKALELPRQHALALARHTRRISSLAGLLQKLALYAKMTGQFLSPEQIEKLATPEGRLPDWQIIVNNVARYMDVKPAEILGSRRMQNLVLARQVAMYLCRRRLGLSYPEIGRLFGGRDHSTVMHGINKILQLREVDKDLHNLLTELENEAE